MKVFIKEELCEEINGLLILLSRSDANREIIVKSLHLMDPVHLAEYRDSLVRDLNIGMTKPRDLDLENEI